MGCYYIMKEVYCPAVDYNTSNVFLLNLCFGLFRCQ